MRAAHFGIRVETADEYVRRLGEWGVRTMSAPVNEYAGPGTYEVAGWLDERGAPFVALVLERKGGGRCG